MGNQHQPGADCLSMFEKLSEYIDNELDDVSCDKIEAHARHCIKCHNCLETLKRTIELCHRTNARPVPSEFSRHLKMLISTLSDS